MSKLNGLGDVDRFLASSRQQNKLFLTKLYSRKDWSAQKTDGTLTPLGKQNTIFLHHTVTEPTVDAFADTRAVQQIAFNKPYADISYNLLVHGFEGIGLEGRGRTIGAHTLKWNEKSFAISVIANAEDDIEKYSYDTVIVACADMIVAMWQMGWLTSTRPDIRLHKSVFQTACPGKHIVARLDMMRQLAYGKIDMFNDRGRFGKPVEATAHAQLFGFI